MQRTNLIDLTILVYEIWLVQDKISGIYITHFNINKEKYLELGSNILLSHNTIETESNTYLPKNIMYLLNNS